MNKLVELYELVGDYLSQEGACPESDPDSDDPMCEQDDCTYCAIARKHFQVTQYRRGGAAISRFPGVKKAGSK